MVFDKYPEELKKLEDIFEPYMVNCELREDAPQEAKEALEKAIKLAFKYGQ